MEAHLIIATRGRASSLHHLLTLISEQSLLPTSLTIVATCEADVAGVAEHPYALKHSLAVLFSSAPGLCAQRNIGLLRVLRSYESQAPSAPFFVAFFDDDYRPAADWLEQCRDGFVSEAGVVGITGCVLADGINGSGISEAECAEYLEGRKPPEVHWASGNEPRELASMYGCNMAFRDRVVRECRFDENLPLYGWQEDQDYTSQAAAHGRTIYFPSCRGVHLGTKTGRVSGVRFGYSQIANPLYLWRKGTMSGRKGLRFVVRHLLSNSSKTVLLDPRNDYRGRLRGNLLAIRDAGRGRCHPTKVLSL